METNFQAGKTVILKLDALIRDTQVLIDKVVHHGLDQTQPEDFEQLFGYFRQCR